MILIEVVGCMAPHPERRVHALTTTACGRNLIWKKGLTYLPSKTPCRSSHTERIRSLAYLPAWLREEGPEPPRPPGTPGPSGPEPRQSCQEPVG